MEKSSVGRAKEKHQAHLPDALSSFFDSLQYSRYCPGRLATFGDIGCQLSGLLICRPWHVSVLNQIVQNELKRVQRIFQSALNLPLGQKQHIPVDLLSTNFPESTLAYSGFI